MTLFREEVLQRRRSDLQGNINVALPVSWSVIGGAMAILTGVTATFLTLATYSRTEVASGNLLPDRGILRVVPVRDGRVETVDVAEGQIVKQGITLARIRVEETDRSGSDAQSNVLAAIESQEGSLVRQIGLGRSAATSEQQQFVAQLHGLQQELDALEVQMRVQRVLVSRAQTDFDQANEIAVRGFISRRDLNLREETLLLRRQQLSSLVQSSAAKAASIAQVTASRRQALANAGAAVAALSSERARVDRDRAATRSEQGYALLAPENGQVSALMIHPGDTVTRADVMMLVVPNYRRLLARFYLPPKAIGFIAAGQPVMLSIDAFPYDRFGTITGKVLTVSSAPVLRAANGGGTEPYYVVTAAIAHSYIQAYGRRQNLLPGMTFSARVVTERRTLGQWLFDPLYAAAGR